MVSWDTRRLIIGILGLQPTCSGDQSNSSLLATISCSCSWRASRQGFGRNAEFQALVIRFVGAIFRTATMPGHFPTHRRRRAVQKLGDLTKRCTGSDPARDVLALRKG